MSRARSAARRCVMQALYQWQIGGHHVEDIDLDFLLEKHGGRLDRDYFKMLLDEVIGQVDAIDELLSPVLDRPLQEVDPVERAILRLGACELKSHPEIPFRVVINESVEIAKDYGAEHGHKYINGILDRIALQLRPDEVKAATKRGEKGRAAGA